jgi:hypothetical protein
MFTPRLLGAPPLPLPYFNKYALDDNVHKTYANDLLPRAVSYSAALLDYFFRGTLELTLPDQGVYATAAPNGTFNEIKLKAKNTTTTGEEMTNGTLQLVVKYRLALSDPFQSVPVTGGPEQYVVIPEKNGVTALSKLTTTELVFDLSTNPVPLWATNAYIQVVFKGKLGNEADAVAVGFADISEPTPVDVYNNTNYVCLNNQWYHASSTEALAITDTNSDGKADRTDIYPHNISNIGIQFGPAGSTPLATSQHK